jgi:hypothetical protein
MADHRDVEYIPFILSQQKIYPESSYDCTGCADVPFRRRRLVVADELFFRFRNCLRIVGKWFIEPLQLFHAYIHRFSLAPRAEPGSAAKGARTNQAASKKVVSLLFFPSSVAGWVGRYRRGYFGFDLDAKLGKDPGSIHQATAAGGQLGHCLVITDTTAVELAAQPFHIVNVTL